jgi:hypothetical protein
MRTSCSSFALIAGRRLGRSISSGRCLWKRKIEKSPVKTGLLAS